MTHRILLTALYGNAPRAGLSYYCAKDINGKTLYCDAGLPAEAACKYVLSAYPIDEIIVFGTDMSFSSGEEKPVILRESAQPFFSESGEMSEFGLLQNRLLQFLEDVNAEAADQDLLLSKEEQQEAITFLRRFFHERIDPEAEKNTTDISIFWFRILLCGVTLKTPSVTGFPQGKQTLNVTGHGLFLISSGNSKQRQNLSRWSRTVQYACAFSMWKRATFSASSTDWYLFSVDWRPMTMFLTP